MKHWKGNIDSFICPVCGLEVSNPRNYPNCACPRCGFQDPRDAKEYHSIIFLLSRAGVIPPAKAQKYVIHVGGRSGGKTLQQHQLQFDYLIDIIAKLSGALEKVLDERDQLIEDVRGMRSVCEICKYANVAHDEEPCESCGLSSKKRKYFMWRGTQEKEEAK